MLSRQIVVSRHGGPDVLEVQLAEVNNPPPGHVVTRVLACGLSFVDILIREGVYPGIPRPPFVSGYTFVGNIAQVGEGVTAVKPGDLVAGLPVTGGHVDAFCSPVDELVALPRELEIVAAAALPLNYMTAYQLLVRAAHLNPGDQVLVHGASGGVGTAMLQLGKLMDLQMYGTSSAEHAPLVSELGAIPIDYRTDDVVAKVRHLTGQGVDAVFDGIGGQVTRQALRALRPGGQLVLYGHHSTLVAGRRDPGHVFTFYASAAATMMRGFFTRRSITLYRIAKLKERHPDWYRTDLLVLADYLKHSKIAPLVATTFPLDEARRAHAMLGKGGMTGTIVLTTT